MKSGGGLLGAAADLPDQDDAFGLVIRWKRSRQAMKSIPLMGSPPIPIQVLWPRPTLVVWKTAS
jgi:hypothetical protein